MTAASGDAVGREGNPLWAVTLGMGLVLLGLLVVGVTGLLESPANARSLDVGLAVGAIVVVLGVLVSGYGAIGAVGSQVG
jgi:hypothetical protein